MLHGMGGSPIVPFGYIDYRIESIDMFNSQVYIWCFLCRSLIGRQLGIRAHSMGLVFCSVPIAGIIIKPFLGGVADK